MTSLHPAAAVQAVSDRALAATGAAVRRCSKAPPPAPHPVDVATVIVHPQPASFPEDFVAETEAINAVEIRPRVGGVLEKRLPEEGQRVKAGQLLFVIDRSPISPRSRRRKQRWRRTRRRSSNRSAIWVAPSRCQKLDAVSQQELDAAVAKNKANVASIEAGKAGVTTARAQSRLSQHRQSHRWRNGTRAAAAGRHRHSQYHAADDRLRNRPHVREPEHQRTATAQPCSASWAGARQTRTVSTPPPFRLFLADGSVYPQIAQAELHRPGCRHAHRHAGDPA